MHPSPKRLTHHHNSWRSRVTDVWRVRSAPISPIDWSDIATSGRIVAGSALKAFDPLPAFLPPAYSFLIRPERDKILNLCVELTESRVSLALFESEVGVISSLIALIVLSFSFCTLHTTTYYRYYVFVSGSGQLSGKHSLSAEIQKELKAAISACLKLITEWYNISYCGK